MAEEITAALAILRQAMDIEQEGRKFYLEAAQTTRDEKGQETFRALAADEQNHFSLLQKQDEALNRENIWVRSPEIKPATVKLDEPLFPRGREALEKAVKTKSGDLEAILFGLEIENKSYDLYRRGAAGMSDPLGKATFEFLAGEERRHFEILMMRYDFLFGPVSWSA